MPRNIVAGNWKMNTLPEDAKILASEISGMAESELNSNVELLVFPPISHAGEVSKLLKGKDIAIGAQNMYFEASGAYTGEVSGEMLKSIGMEYVLIGHSERREIFKEDNEMLFKKVKKSLEIDLMPIFCCGEPLEIRESNTEKEFVANQFKELFSLSKDDFSRLILAYEPIWAIGTGKTASPEQAQEMHEYIRSIIAKNYDENTASQMNILYGGSVKPGNAKELFECKDVNGALVGGASLKSRDFIDIAKSF